VLGSADAVVATHALDATYLLPVPSSCTAEGVRVTDLPAAPELRARVRVGERALAQASALSSAGSDRAALDIVERVLPEARAIPSPRLEAELLLLAAICDHHLGDNPGGLAANQDAFLAAESAADDALAATAAAGAAFELAAWLGKGREGERWIDIAERIAGRVGHDDGLEATVLHSRAVVTIMAGHPEGTLEAQDREIAILERLYGDKDPRVAIGTMNKGVVLAYMGQAEPAIEAFRRTIEILQEIGGPDNPQSDLPYANMGFPLTQIGRFDEGRAAFERALALQGDRLLGSITVQALAGLSALELQSGNARAAIERARKGLEVADAMGDGGAKDAPILLTVRGMARTETGDAKGATEDCRRALSMQEATGSLDPGAVYGPDSLCCLGEAELALGRTGAALEHLERSVSFERRPDPAEFAKARFTLARALRAAARDPERAMTLARAARGALGPGHDALIAAIDRWLTER
jgi:tetratricopeptide (TPR) repeat protein